MSIQKRAKLVPWLASFAVLVLVAILAVPSLAAPTGTKYYKYSVSPTSVETGTTQTFTVSITNTSPKQSSSNISSVSVQVPSPLTLQSASISSASNNGDNSAAVVSINSAGATNCVPSSGSQVSVCNLAPVKSTKTVVLSITAAVGGNPSCGGSVTTDPWIVKANTGSQLNGDPFDVDPAQAAGTLTGFPFPATTTITKTCNASISGQVWRDHDNDGTKDTDEGPQSGWTVNLFNGPSLLDSQVTGANGNYSFTGLSAGSYLVCETAPTSNPSYIGWVQSVPTSTDCSSTTGVEPNGYGVTLATSSTTVTGKDFLNVQTIVVPADPDITTTCDITDPSFPTDGIYTVGNGTTEPYATVTLYPPNCKPGEYVFESWVDSNGDQKVAFYPTFPKTNNLVPITQSVDWVIDGDKSQRTLFYNDNVAGVPDRAVLFCNADSNGYVSMPDPVAPDTAAHTTCLLSTTETATATGVLRHDEVVTLVDGTLYTTTKK
jgi:hypothetical protein